MSAKKLGNVLVVGGCGFIGHHIVRALLEDPDAEEVHVLSRRPSSNRISAAFYHAGDITSYDALQSCLTKVQPRVVIHAASPDPFEDPPNPSAYYKINIEGTKNLITCAKECPSVIAFIYTSSTTVVINNSRGECFMADEDSPIYGGPFDHGPDSYFHSKGMADGMVRAANHPSGPASESLQTGCIRVGAAYGEGDSNMTWMGLELAKQGRSFLQFGDNTSLYDPVYVGNVADLHLLLAKALVRGPHGAHKVDGEAFNVTDDAPVPFWNFTRQIFAAAGVHQPVDEVWVIPTWLILILASCTEWLYWIFYRGQRRPRHLQVKKIEFLCKTRTWSVAKAKERLGWKPRFSTEEGIQRGVKWALKKWEEDENKWKLQ
ncbi:MAG: hypothetical protein LQ340_003819 [Diploschistes diacapsis]|nr:MAG: hypothetical protein LQ340_003819 [Diploschistes diacapsis]